MAEHDGRERVLLSSTRKKYAMVSSATKSLLTRDELRSIDRYIDTTATKASVHTGDNLPSRHIPALPFEKLEPHGDDVLQMRVCSIHPHESALDAPLRFIAPEEYHSPEFEDPPANLPLARRVVALLKGVESVPMTWSKRPARSTDRWTTHIKVLKDAEVRAQSSLRSGDTMRGAHLLCTMGSLHYNCGNIEMAIPAFTKSLRAFESLNNAKGVAYCHNILGVCYFRLTEYKMALVHHKKQEPLGGHYAKCVAQVNMGVSYAALGELSYAEQAFTDALSNAKKSGNGMLITVATGNLGLVSLRVGNMRTAQLNLEQCLELCSIAGDKSGAAVLLLLLGEIYARIDDHQHALFYFEHAYRVGGEANGADLVEVARVSIGIARGNAAIRDAILSEATRMGHKNDIHSIVKLLPS